VGGGGGGRGVDLVGFGLQVSLDARRLHTQLTFEVVLGGSGFLLVGLGVGVGVEPSSHRSPMQVMTYVWRGTRACSFAGACLYQYRVFHCDEVIHTADETARSVEMRTDRVTSCMMTVFGHGQDV
jgi:hypothetical protein